MDTPTGEMRELNKMGDSKVMWNRNNREEVEAARAHFNALRSKGYAAYRAEGKEGTRGEIIRDFDSNAERIIMVPPVSGG